MEALPEPVAAEHVLHEVAKRVSLRATHPNLFRSLLTVAGLQVALALNFFTSNPTFNPLPKNVIGAVFLVLGVSLAVVLTAFRRLMLVRVFAGLSVFVWGSWGFLNTEQFFDDKASLQLPMLYVGLAALVIPLLMEPWFNPITATANGNGKKLNGTF